jgi:hypothetical protein
VGAVVTRYTVRLDGAELRLDVDGIGNLPMIPISATSFSPPIGGVYEFVVGGTGIATAMHIHGVSGSSTATRVEGAGRD